MEFYCSLLYVTLRSFRRGILNRRTFHEHLVVELYREADMHNLSWDHGIPTLQKLLSYRYRRYSFWRYYKLLTNILWHWMGTFELKRVIYSFVIQVSKGLSGGRAISSSKKIFMDLITDSLGGMTLWVWSSEEWILLQICNSILHIKPIIVTDYHYYKKTT